jgi:hypothetical protein
MRSKFAASLAAIGLMLACGSAASAAVTSLTFTTPGAQPQIYFNGFVPGTSVVDPTLNAELTFTLNSITNGGYLWNFSYSLTNTSTAPSRLATLGWNVDPNYATASNVSGVFSEWSANRNIASLDPVEFCLKNTPGASCSGGGGGGLIQGASGAGVFSLAFASQSISYTYVQQPVYNPKGKIIRYETVAVPQVTAIAAPNTVTFSDFGMHLQSLAGGLSTVAVPGDRPLPPVSGAIPEPAQWALMITGFFGAGSALRIRRRRVLAA